VPNSPGHPPAKRPPLRCACGIHWFSRTNLWGVVLVSDGDQRLLIEYAWTITKGYASSWRYRRAHGIRFLHQAIAGRYPDHENGNGLDNRNENLRRASRLENARNRRKSRDNSSGFKGVHFDGALKRPWRATIETKRRCFHIGNFATPEEAAHAYDRQAIIKFGRFARLNFPPQTT